MTLVAHGEIITIGEDRYSLLEEITATPEAILALEGLENRVLVAQGLDENGEVLTRTKPAEKFPCPVYPTPETLQQDPNAKAKYRQDYEEFLRRSARQKPDEEVPVPPAVGRPKLTGEDSAYFHLEQFDTTATRILPLALGERSGGALYRFQIAEIVE